MHYQQKENIIYSASSLRKAEVMLRQQVYFIQQFTNTTPNMILVLNLKQKALSFVNSPTAKLLGISEEELDVNGPALFRSCVHPDDLHSREEFYRNLHTLRDDEVRVMEIRLKTADGGYRWYKLKDKVFERDRQGKVLQTICIIQDVNERRHAEEENTKLQKLQRKTETDQQKIVVRETLTALEEDNKRLAQSITEGLGQMLFAVKLSFNRLQYDLAFKSSASLKQYKQEVDRLLTACIQEGRRIAHELMPILVEGFGLTQAIEDLCKQYSNGFLQVSYRIKGAGKPIEKYLDLAIYRMVQELVINTVHHADATKASIEIIYNGTDIRLVVTDNGKNQEQQDAGQESLSLKLIKRKLKLLKGTFERTIGGKRGTKVKITMPLE
jgi:PAS domain S-box-containing protein